MRVWLHLPGSIKIPKINFVLQWGRYLPAFIKCIPSSPNSIFSQIFFFFNFASWLPYITQFKGNTPFASCPRKLDSSLSFPFWTIQKSPNDSSSVLYFTSKSPALCTHTIVSTITSPSRPLKQHSWVPLTGIHKFTLNKSRAQSIIRNILVQSEFPFIYEDSSHLSHL